MRQALSVWCSVFIFLLLFFKLLRQERIRNLRIRLSFTAFHNFPHKHGHNTLFTAFILLNLQRKLFYHFLNNWQNRIMVALLDKIQSLCHFQRGWLKILQQFGEKTFGCDRITNFSAVHQRYQFRQFLRPLWKFNGWQVKFVQIRFYGTHHPVGGCLEVFGVFTNLFEILRDIPGIG